MFYRLRVVLFTLSSEEDMPLPAGVYRPRQPQDSDYYHCIEDYFEIFVQVYDVHFSRQYGFWRPYVEQVIYRYLDCGDLHNGFARVKCKDCSHEYLLAFPCNCRCFQSAIFITFLSSSLSSCRCCQRPAQSIFSSIALMEFG